MDDDEKQMEGGRVSKLSGDYLPVTQVELSRCIVGRQHACPGSCGLRADQSEKAVAAQLLAAAEVAHVRCEIATAKKTNNLRAQDNDMKPEALANW